MSLLLVAFRSVFRNRRRSVMTIAAIGVGAVSVLIIGALLIFVLLDFQSSVVRRIGHLTVYKAGYFDYGAGNPSQYGIGNYGATMLLFENDPILKPLIRVITPIQDVMGIAGNYAADRSTPFFGAGVNVEARARMNQWDGFGLGTGGNGKPDIPNTPDSGAVGYGLGRILGLCGPLHIPNCPAPPRRAGGVQERRADPEITGITALEQEGERPADGRKSGDPRIDLLAATAAGAPNVVSVYVDHAEFQGNRNTDDSFVLMHLQLAQDLVYGRGERKVTGIVLQLYRTSELNAVRVRLRQLFATHGLDFEVRDFSELTPLYSQVLAFFVFLFGFIAIVLALIVLFTVVNTMGMAVMERVDEIGTLRALGLQRAQIRLQFIFEGCLLGVLGASSGALLAELVAHATNACHLTWTPPTAGGPVPLRLTIPYWLIVGTWCLLSVLASLAAAFPANRATKMTIVDALRHV